MRLSRLGVAALIISIIGVIGATIAILVRNESDGVIHSAVEGDVELTIVTKQLKGALDPPSMFLYIRHNGMTHTQHLGKMSTGFRFETVVFDAGNVVGIVEKHHPRIVIAAYDKSSGRYWPWWDAEPFSKAMNAKEEIQKKISASAGNSNYELGELSYDYPH